MAPTPTIVLPCPNPSLCVAGVFVSFEVGNHGKNITRFGEKWVKKTFLVLHQNLSGRFLNRVLPRFFNLQELSIVSLKTLSPKTLLDLAQILGGRFGVTSGLASVDIL